ncbi:hypothetical protein CPB85DRAFT_696891 [Mucidula mucida]|nr:hypothetical protein CPB85DRAFT_696891 [Mucidula mucida]
MSCSPPIRWCCEVLTMRIMTSIRFQAPHFNWTSRHRRCSSETSIAFYNTSFHLCSSSLFPCTGSIAQTNPTPTRINTGSIQWLNNLTELGSTHAFGRLGDEFVLCLNFWLNYVTAPFAMPHVTSSLGRLQRLISTHRRRVDIRQGPYYFDVYAAMLRTGHPCDSFVTTTVCYTIFRRGFQLLSLGRGECRRQARNATHVAGRNLIGECRHSRALWRRAAL